MSEPEAPAAEAEGPSQTVKRMPDESEIGPFFPSGMNTVEAAHAGATAGLSDADKKALGIEGGGEEAPAEEEPSE